MRSWSWIPALGFALLMLHAATLGLTDDEAYYWVLAQRPSLGFAFHPPMVTWVIGAVQFVLQPLLGVNSVAVTRLPAVLCATVVLALALSWLQDTGAMRSRIGKGGLAFISFAGFYALSWMIVPDLPLFLGWMIAYWGTWRICFHPEDDARVPTVALAAGIAVAVLSKYSGVLAAASAFFCLLNWTRGRRLRNGLVAIAAGLALAAIPILVWNAQHGWASILYQIRDRHEGGGISWIRFGRFWAVQLVVAGPVLVWFAGVTLVRFARGTDVISRFTGWWMLPGLIFCVQPLFSDFKPHWAFVVWWPAALALGWAYAVGRSPRDRRLARVQSGYGIVLIALIAVSTHFPVMAWIGDRTGKPLEDPRLDVSNDMMGWDGLPEWMSRELTPEEARLPVLGSRYQTASQAAFALGDLSRVALLPRDPRTRDEWPELPVSESVGPEWPRLTAPVLYVADNRYDLGPQYPSTTCTRRGRMETRRAGYLSKWIDVWRCEPAAPRP